MAPALGVSGIGLGGALFAVGLVIANVPLIIIGFLMIFFAGIWAFNMGAAYN